MTLADVMAQLETLGDERVRAMNAKNGAGENQFGVKMGDLRVLAKQIKTNPELAKQLWKTGNIEARLLATLLMRPKDLATAEVDRMVRSATYTWLAEWLTSYVVKQHPEKEKLRQQWMADADPMAARAGWSLTTERVIKDPSGLDLSALLDRIEAEMGSAHEMPKWTMNFCLGEIGINHPVHRQRAIAIGEKIGAYRDYPTSKGCVSPYVPTWVAEMVRRQG